MCSAILRIKYLADKSAQYVEVANDRELQQRVSELQDKDQVVSIQVFARKHDFVLTKKWEVQLYTTPVEETA